MKVTMKDIALEANVSITVVSHVINNKPGRVSDATRKHILEIAKRLNYVPNYSAKQLVTQKSNTIGIIVPDLENYFFASLVSRLQDAMRKRGYFMLVSTSNDDVESDLESVELLVSRGVEALVIAVSNNAHECEERYLSRFENIVSPVILVDRVLEQFKGSWIQFDHKKGMEHMTQYVLSQNHKNIAFVNGDPSMVRSNSRLQGFLSAMRNESQSSYDIYPGNYSFEKGYELFDSIFDKNKYTAIIAANDMMAYGLMKRAFERQLMIPDDVSICGYDNVMFSEMINPTLTTVNQNINSLVEQTVRMLEDIVEGNKNNEQITLEPELMVRHSVKKLKR